MGGQGSDGQPMGDAGPEVSLWSDLRATGGRVKGFRGSVLLTNCIAKWNKGEILMATEIRLRRGTSAQHTTFTGAEGEPTYDASLQTIRVHDGSTAGGHRLAKFSELGQGLPSLPDKAALQATTDDFEEFVILSSTGNIYKMLPGNTRSDNGVELLVDAAGRRWGLWNGYYDDHFTVTVHHSNASADFAEIQSAIEHLMRFQPGAVAGSGHRVEIWLLAGAIVHTPVNVRNVDLSWMVIRGADAKTSVADTWAAEAHLFSYQYSANGPIIDQLFDMHGRGRDGLSVRFSSRARVFPEAGVLNAGRRGVVSYRGSWVDVSSKPVENGRTRWKNAKSYPLESHRGSWLNAAGADLTIDNGDPDWNTSPIQCSLGSHMNLTQAIVVRNDDRVEIRAHSGGIIMASGLDFNASTGAYDRSDRLPKRTQPAGNNFTERGIITGDSRNAYGVRASFQPSIEGSSVAGTNVYSIRNGNYFIANEMVFYSVYITILSTADGGVFNSEGELSITGLPHIVRGIDADSPNINFQRWITPVQFNRITLDSTSCGLFAYMNISPGNNRRFFNLVEQRAHGTTVPVEHTQIDISTASLRISFSGFYPYQTPAMYIP